MSGKTGRKIDTSRPTARAASSAHVSGPAHPPETTMESLGNDLTKSLIDWEFVNFLDPITPTLMGKNFLISDPPKSSLHHHRRSFMGCFSCRLRKNIDYEAFRRWKDNPGTEKTKEIAEIIAGYITNHYDFITTAPPSKNRDLNNYCCFRVCEEISSATGIPFVVSFQQRKHKSRHGRYASMEAERPLLVSGWNHNGKSILFVDDFITSGMTAKSCYEVLRGQGNHVDGLIYCEY